MTQRIPMVHTHEASHSTHAHSAYVFSASNGVGFGTNGSTVTASYSQSTHAHTDSGIGIAPGTDGATSVGVVTFSNANGLAFGSSAGSVVTGSYTQSTHPHSAFVLSASNDFVFGTNASTVTASFSQSTHAHSDTGVGVKVNGANATSAGVVDFADANGIGWGRAASQITASYTQSTHAHTDSGVGIQVNGANSTSAGVVDFVNANGVTFGRNASTITVAYSQSTAPSAIVAGTLSTYTSGSVILSASTNLTISTNGQTILFSGPAAAGAPALSYWQNASGGSASVNMNSVLLSASAGSLIVFPLGHNGGFPGDMTVSTAMLNMTHSVSGLSSLSAYSSSWRVGLYTVSTAAGGGSTLALVNSVLTTAGSAASNLSLSTVLVGNRFLTIHSSAWSAEPVLTGGREYYVGLVHNTAGTRAQTYGMYGQFLFSTQARSGSIGVSQPAAATWQGITPYAGVYSATTAALPASIHLTELNKQVANAFFVPHMIFNNRVSSF